VQPEESGVLRSKKILGCRKCQFGESTSGAVTMAVEPRPQTSEDTPKPPRNRRTKNYWEPFYDPDERNPFPVHPWNFDHNGAPTHVTFTADGLTAALKDGRSPRFDKLRFVKCDFLGSFDVSPRDIVFKNCIFEECDFGLSIWKRAKFTSCSLHRVSMTQSTWRECDFRACTWDQIAISGNETIWDATTITNPGTFIRAAYTNLDDGVLAKRHTTAQYQKMRLESTKATVARALSRMFSNYGDERAFYDALKCSSNQSTRARIFEALYDLRAGTFKTRCKAALSLPLNLLDWLILNGAGIVNAWGRSIVRPALIGLAIVVLFGLAYYATDPSINWANALIKATEITLLIGYTNHSSPSLPVGKHELVLVNMIAGLLWYVVFIPTLVNRISRIR
jgi:hypothetical protein